MAVSHSNKIKVHVVHAQPTSNRTMLCLLGSVLELFVFYFLASQYGEKVTPFLVTEFLPECTLLSKAD